MLIGMPSRRLATTVVALAFLLIFGLLLLPSSRDTLQELLPLKPERLPGAKPTPKYKPTPTYVPPPIKDNFPLLATSTPLPIPSWNVPRTDLHQEYDLPIGAPLLIGFTRTWPLLLQVVVSYITAGWPADQIYVVENTGVQQANARGQLSLQNPFYLNHTVLHALGVNVITTPTLLSFAQMQNFFLSLTYTHNWPYYFWGHMDVVVLSYEDGFKGHTPRYNQPGYKTIYELALTALRKARTSDPRWGLRFFAYDHLALVNPAAFEDVGGWDTLIPYYLTDCDMHSRLKMRNWTMKDAKAGIITDVASALADLRAFYRVDGVAPKFTDPNPPPPKPAAKEKKPRWEWTRRLTWRDEPVAPPKAPAEEEKEEEEETNISPRDGDGDANLPRWHALRKTADRMFQHKHGDRERNTWQLGQQGGQGEPFHYPAAGLAEAIELVTETGREVYRRKWGHRDCDLITGAGLKFGDAWRVEKDWKD